MSKFKESLSQTIRKQLHERAVREHQQRMLMQLNEEEERPVNVPPPRAPGGIQQWTPPAGLDFPGNIQPRPKYPVPHFHPNTPSVTPPPFEQPPEGPFFPLSPEFQYYPAIPWFSPYNPWDPGYNVPFHWYDPSTWNWQLF